MALTSQFTSLLDTNYAPAPAELDEIRRVLRGPEFELREIEEKLRRLQERRDELKSFIDRHRALLSPIRQIPREVLEAIFLQCRSPESFPVCSVKEAPLLLTTICRTWRTVALSSPRLWRAIHISLPTALHPDLRTTMELVIGKQQRGVQQWLDRSGSLPISISLYTGLWSRAESDGNDQFFHDTEFVESVMNMYGLFVRMLMGYSSRWKYLCLSEVPTPVLEVIGTLEENAVPILETFRLVRYNTILEPFIFRGEAIQMRNLLRAPNLRHLYLTGDFVSPPIYPVRWGMLVELEITKPSGTRSGILSPHLALNILTRCTSALRSLIMDICPPKEMMPYCSPTLDFPNLQELNLEFYRDMIWGNVGPAEGEDLLNIMKLIFDTINAPSLTCLAVMLDGLKLPLINEPPPFIPFLQRSQCELRYLSLRMPLRDQVIIDCLSLMPSLTILKLAEYRLDDLDDQYREFLPRYFDPERVSCNTITEKFIHALTSSPTPFPGCKRLEKVHLISVSPSIAGALFRLSKARRHPFRTFRVDFCDFLQETEGTVVSSWLKELKNNGWDVRWRSPVSQQRKLVGNANEGFIANPFPFADIIEDPNSRLQLELVY